MMELLITTKQRAQVTNNLPQVYLPFHYGYPVGRAQTPQQDSSSEPSETTSEEEEIKVPTPLIPIIATPDPPAEEESVSSQSDSFECQSNNMGDIPNF